ncbi:hypothetical protein OUZ56_011928 [Daphnia magna]|uniref:Uncharacterized protein n=1 Tax=Daphnia magna TaxID=35525 RepID=A0ABQ9Z1V2_9CRUS|nr:hypothetical protein OUZ56_011928 [Daphnia magna]
MPGFLSAAFCPNSEVTESHEVTVSHYRGEYFLSNPTFRSSPTWTKEGDCLLDSKVTLPYTSATPFTPKASCSR